MNISRVISSIIQQQGLYYINLPFNEPTENVIQNILKTTTIPTFSQFAPNRKQYTCWTRDIKKIDNEEAIYQLPASLTTTNVISVLDVDIPPYTQRGAYGDITPAYGISRSVMGVATAQAYMMVAGRMRNEPTFEYLGNNKIKLYGYPSGRIRFVVSCEHDDNGESIDPGYYDSFLELATLDAKVFMYNNLKQFDNIASAFGTINLKIEEYQSAEADRKALLDQWRDSFHLDMIDWIEFM